jgi:hypothetical protein
MTDSFLMSSRSCLGMFKYTWAFVVDQLRKRALAALDTLAQSYPIPLRLSSRTRSRLRPPSAFGNFTFAECEALLWHSPYILRELFSCSTLKTLKLSRAETIAKSASTTEQQAPDALVRLLTCARTAYSTVFSAASYESVQSAFLAYRRLYRDLVGSEACNFPVFHGMFTRSCLVLC